MTRAERRAAMPIVTKFVDELRAEFGDGLKILYAEENGVTWGEKQREGVIPVLYVPHEKKRARK